MRNFATTEPVTISLVGGSFNGTLTGHVTRNSEPQPNFRAHEEILRVGDSVEMNVSGQHGYSTRELSRGDVGTVVRMSMDLAIVKFWRYPELELDIPVSCLRYVKP